MTLLNTWLLTHCQLSSKGSIWASLMTGGSGVEAAQIWQRVRCLHLSRAEAGGLFGWLWCPGLSLSASAFMAA